MSVRRTLIFLTFVMLVLPVVVYAQNQRQNAPEPLPDLNNFETYPVQQGRVEQIVSAIGTIEADQTVSLSLLVPGRVSEVFVKSGDYMFAGEPLLRLENETQRIAYEQAQLAVDKAQLALDDILAPVSEDDLAIAQAAVDSAWGSYLSLQNAVTGDDLRAAELAYEQAYNTYETLKDARDQAPGGYGGSTYNSLDAQTGAASFNAEIARLRLEILRTGNRAAQGAAYARVVLAQREYDRVAAGPTPFQIDSAALGVKTAESQLRRAETAYNRTVLTAPFDGLISTVNTEVGGIAAPGLAVIEMTDVSPLRLTVQVDEVDIRLINAGLPARVELDALPDVSIPAEIEQIALVGTNENGIVSYDVDLTLDANDPRVRVGMTAEANVIVTERENVLVIPNIYVRLDRERAFVNLLRPDGTIEEVEVTLGLQGQETSEVVDGLEEGDVIVIDPDGEGVSFF